MPARPPARRQALIPARRQALIMARRQALALALLLALAGASCDALGGGDTQDVTPGVTAAEGDDADPGSAPGPTTLPDAGDVVATTTSRVRPGIELGIREPVQYDDGTMRLSVDVVNTSNEDVDVDSAIPFSGRRMNLRVVDPQGPSRYWPMADDDTDRCLCSGYDFDLVVASGTTVTIDAIYEGLREGLEAVRIEPWEYVPVDDVAVRQEAVPTPVAGGATVSVVGDDDLEVTVASMTATPDGTVVSLRLANVGAAQPVEVRDFPDLRWLHLVDLQARDSYARVAVDGDAITNLPDQPEPIVVGGDLAVDVLFPSPAPSATALSLGSPDLPLGPPVALGEGEVPDDLDVPWSPDAPRNEAMASKQERYETPLVPVTEAVRVAAGATGPAVVVPDVAGRLTSDAQPGWAIGVRGVVRGPGPLSTLVLDLTDTGAERWWPEGLGVDNESNLGLLAVIDPAAGQRLEVLRSGRVALSADEAEDPLDTDETNLLYALLPGVSAEATAVSVEVPGFGRVDEVPVVDMVAGSGGDGGGDDGRVLASMGVRDIPGLRRDVLAVSRLDDGNGTLVRVRDVNGDDPDTFDTPFESDICDMDLYDPASQRVFDVLDPCTGSVPSGRLGLGESLVHELRFPTLPAGVEEVVVLARGFLPSGTVDVTSGDLPWYAMLPAEAGESSGGVYVASVGPADGAQVVREEDQEVEVTLANDVLFATDSAELSDQAAVVIDDVAAQLEADAVPGVVRVVGHTDARGTDERTAELSLRRAASVQAALDQRLTRPDLSLEVDGRGAAEPVAPNEVEGRDNPDGRARNRRVTVTYAVAR